MANEPRVISGDIIAFEDKTGMGKIRPNDGSEEVVFHFEDLLNLGALQDGDETKILAGLKGTPVSVTNIPALYNEAEKSWEVPLQEEATERPVVTIAQEAEIDDQPDFGALYDDRYSDPSSQPIRKPVAPRDNRPPAQAADGQPDTAWQGAAGDVSQPRRAVPTEQPDFPADFGQDTPVFGGGVTAPPSTPVSSTAVPTAGERQSGRVKFFNVSKGFGFIEPDNGGKDIFVHATKVPDGLTLTENMRITFGTQPGRKGGSEAIDLRPETAPAANAEDIANYSGAAPVTSARPIVVVKRTSRKPPPGTEGQS